MIKTIMDSIREPDLPDGLDQVEERLREICCGDGRWTKLFSGTVTRGGKRLRPALVLLCASFRPAPRAGLTDVAAAVELIHAASLVHDDVIDHADTRRGRPTISSRWGAEPAVLYGDFLFARSFWLLSRHGYTEILNNMTKAISMMCEGEIEQSRSRYDCNIDERFYWSYIHKKTAYFLSACCLAGAAVCGLPSVYQKCLGAYGLNLGYAFQITDDLLDISGTTATLGKPAFHDLAEGVLTLPVIKLLQRPAYSTPVREIIAQRDFTKENLTFIHNALAECGIITEIQEKARSVIGRAKQFLTALPDTPHRSILIKFADYILHRSF